MQLVRPAPEHLDSYAAALQRGWSPDNVRGRAAADEELAAIDADAAGFLATMEDRRAAGPRVRLPDGSDVERLPGFRRWIWDGGEFCGSIGLRWQPGTTALPPHCLGHIGYAVVPWRQRQGLATAALRGFLPQAWHLGLAHVEITTDPDNRASQRVIEANGGVLVERFVKPPQFGATPGLRYRIDAPRGAAAAMSFGLYGAFVFTIALLVTTAFFLMGGLPLLILKHDVPLDARFVRRFFEIYYTAAFWLALGACLSYALWGRWTFAAGMAVIALVATLLRRRLLPAMQALGARIESSDAEAIRRFRRVHAAALLVNLTQLVVLVWGIIGLSRQLA